MAQWVSSDPDDTEYREQLYYKMSAMMDIEFALKGEITPDETDG